MTNSYKDISHAVANGHLLNAIGMLRHNLDEKRSPKLIDDLQRAESTYRYLLKYMREGQEDPSRKKVISTVSEDLLDIARIMEDDNVDQSSTSLFFTGRRLVKFSKMNFAETLGRYISADATLQLSSPDSKEYKEALSVKHLALKDLFTYVWTLPVASKKELKDITGVVVDKDISFALRGVIVGALLLSLLRVYDRAKLNTLLNIATTSPDERIRARAYTSIALVLDRYPVRIGRDESMRERFEALCDDLTFYTRMRETVYALVKARGGMKFLGKMKSEIIPDIQKFGPDIINKLKNNDGEISIESLEENPEWENMLRETGMEKKLRRLNDMQTNGADMMLSMFEQVRYNTLFNDIDIWFRPFDSWEAERLGIPETMNPLLDSFRLNPGFCDTDKYAMLSNMMRLPESARNLLKNGFDAQAQQMAEEFKDMVLHTKTPDFELECYNFSRNLFRFFTFFRQKNEFFNPFDRSLTFYKWPYIGKMLSESEILTSVGEYYFKQEFYEDAVAVFDTLADSMSYLSMEEYTDDHKLLVYCREKAAIACEKLGKYEEAMERYEDAHYLVGDDEWLAERIAKLLLSYDGIDNEIAFSALRTMYNRDKNNLEYLLPYTEHMFYAEFTTNPDDFAKAVERAVYLASENPRVIRLQAKKILKVDNNPAEAQKILTPLVDNAEMYLASASLNANLADESRPVQDEEAKSEENQMLTDLSFSLLVASIQGDTATILARLNSILSLPVLRPTSADINRVLDKEFSETRFSKDCKQLASKLPLYTDALSDQSFQ